MFLLSRHSKSTCMVHVGGAAWLYYIRRIVHLELVFRQRKLLIIPPFLRLCVFNHTHIIYHCIPLSLSPYVLSVSFSRWRWVDVCARTRSAWTCWWQSPCYRDRYGKKVRNLMSPVSAEEPSGYFCYTPSLFFIFLFFHINCALVYINFLCYVAFVIYLFTTTNITLCIYLNNNILFFTLGLVFYIKLILKN